MRHLTGLRSGGIWNVHLRPIAQKKSLTLLLHFDWLLNRQRFLLCTIGREIATYFLDA
jgi:hypothetical protein